MGGTLLNMLTVFIGSLVGLLVGNRLPARMQESVVTGLGLVTLKFPLLALGISLVILLVMMLAARWIWQLLRRSSATRPA